MSGRQHELLYDAGTGYAMVVSELLDTIVAMVGAPREAKAAIPALPVYGRLEPLAARIVTNGRHVAAALEAHRCRLQDGPIVSSSGPDFAPRLIDGLDAVFDYVRELRRIARIEAPELNDAMQMVWRGEAVMDNDGYITKRRATE